MAEPTLDFNIDQTKYDDCNALILSGKKKSKALDKIKKNKIKPIVLSKKKKKRLQKILEKKSKKINRAQLLNDLSEYQAKTGELDLMPSTSAIQTAGRKRVTDLIEYYKAVNAKNLNQSKTDENFRFKKIKIPNIPMKNNEKNFFRQNPNVVGFEDDTSESSVDDQSDEEDEEEEIIKESVNKKEDESKDVIKNELPESNENVVQVGTKASNLKECSENKKEGKEEEPKKELNFVKTVFVPVDRNEDVQKARLELPILREECAIMEAIMYNPVVIICGETGSGKTTQLPQFLYESGFTMNDRMIGVTEPRRVAAISMSKRVGYELNLSSNEVSYQIRYEGNVTSKTKIKFMTDGVLMKEIQNDFLLRKYSVIIIDEAHERSLYSDILIGFLSRLVQTREKRGDPLKLIIMSATLRVEDFTTNTRLFKTIPPVLKIESRQYPVSVHFSKQTNPNYIKEAFKKVCKIHSTLPDGGILVFLTGRQEIKRLCHLLKEKYPLNGSFEDDDESDQETIKDSNVQSSKEQTLNEEKKKQQQSTSINLDRYSVTPNDVERTIDDFDYLENDIEQEKNDDESDVDDDDILDDVDTDKPLYCLPLYSTMPNHEQARVFKKPPPGSRLCVIATNIAETSLTIPDIKYVVDTGKVKNKVYDSITGISTFLIEWISKAAADQRTGRAGRTCPGRCFRLYSSAVYNNDFPKYSNPEILIKPIDDLVLQMKAIGISNVANFPFPSPPKIESILSSEKRLIQLEALEEHTIYGKRHKKISIPKITPLGRVMSYFPVNPRYSKMLCLSIQSNLLPYVIAIISGLTVQEIFILSENENCKNSSKNIFHHNPNCIFLGDIMSLLAAIGSVSFEGLSEKFCLHYNLRYKAMVEINKLRMQLSKQIKELFPDLDIPMKLTPPDDKQVKLLRQLVLCGFLDHVAKRIPVTTVTQTDDNGNITKNEKTIRNCYQSIEVESPVFISPHSALFNETPEYVIYHDIFESNERMYMRYIVPIDVQWLPVYAAKLCTFSNPLTEPSPKYDAIEDKVKCHRKSTFGPFIWELPATEVNYPEGIDKYRYFAYFLFKGNVISWFGKRTKYLTIDPAIFTMTWAFVQPNVECLVTTLSSSKVASKVGLINEWKNNSKFLLNEYLGFVQEEHKSTIRSSWPPKV